MTGPDAILQVRTGLGVLGASPDPPDSPRVMAGRMAELTDRPWGVDLIRANTAFGPASTEEHVTACLELGVRLVVFHHEPPPASWVRRLRGAGARVWTQVSSVELASAAVALGVDGLVAQGREAGGHARGTRPLSALLGEVRARCPDALLLGAGGIADGAAVARARRAGADGVWGGTRLVASAEAYAHPEYQRRLLASTGATARTTAFGPEWPDQPYRPLATPAVLDPRPGSGTIGRTWLFPHSANLP